MKPRSIRGRARRWISLALLALAVVLTLQTSCKPSEPTRAADLDWLAQQLPKLHPDLFFQLPETQYKQAIGHLRARLDELDDAKYYVALAQIVASIGDDHTTLSLPAAEQEAYGSYPIGLYFFPDGLYVTRADESISELVGHRLVSIEGIPVEQVVASIAALIPKAGDSLVLFRAPVLMVRPEVLYGLGLAQSREQASFAFLGPDGEETELQLNATKPWAITWSAGSWSTPPAYRYSYNIWHTYLAEHRTLYILYYSCQGDLTQQTAAIVRVLDSQPVERIVFDMRRNAGGNPAVAQRLIETLAARPEVRAPGHLFVIVGRRTYSSTIPNCYDFRRQTVAIFFGEPTGGRPSGFGLAKTAELPYSRYVVQYSTSRFMSFVGNLTSFVPDYLVEQTAEDYAAGRDTVLEAILRYGKPE